MCCCRTAADIDAPVAYGGIRTPGVDCDAAGTACAALDGELRRRTGAGAAASRPVATPSRRPLTTLAACTTGTTSTQLSDVVGRRGVFLALVLLHTPTRLLLPATRTPAPLALLGMLVLPCYGGGFGTLAACPADDCGPTQVGVIFGLLMTACGVGGAAGPLLIAVVRAPSDGSGPALVVLAAGMLLGAAVALALRPPRSPTPRLAAPAAPRRARPSARPGRQGRRFDDRPRTGMARTPAARAAGLQADHGLGPGRAE
jgi:hypothetical protein